MQWTLAAARIAFTAILLAGANDQGVKFIIQRHVFGQATLQQLAYLVVAVSRSSELMALQHPSGVRIDYKYPVLAGVQQDGIRRFRAYRVNSEQLFA